MMTEQDRLALQADFDGELDETEQRKLRERLADDADAQAYLSELSSLNSVLAQAEVPQMPPELERHIKAGIPAPPVSEGGGSSYALAIAASMVLAVGLGALLLPSQTITTEHKAAMTGTLLPAEEVIVSSQFGTGDLRAEVSLIRDVQQWQVHIAVEGAPASEAIATLLGGQWHWQPGVANSSAPNGSDASSVVRFAVDGSARLEFPLLPGAGEGQELTLQLFDSRKQPQGIVTLPLPDTIE